MICGWNKIMAPQDNFRQKSYSISGLFREQAKQKVRVFNKCVFFSPCLRYGVWTNQPTNKSRKSLITTQQFRLRDKRYSLIQKVGYRTGTDMRYVNSAHVKQAWDSYTWSDNKVRELIAVTYCWIPPWSPSKYSPWKAMHRCQRLVHP